MRIAVCLKQVPDPATIEVDPFTGVIDSRRLLYILNPDDETALETALQLRQPDDTVLALTVGPAEAETVLREALAVGADAVLRLWEEERTSTKPAVTSVLLAAALRAEGLPDLILCGACSVDRGSGKLPALLGEHLDLPVVTDVARFELRNGSAFVQRRLARGVRAEGEVRLPAVLALEEGLRLRHPSLPGLIQAKRATVPVRYPADLGLSPQDLHFPMTTLHQAMPPRPRPRAIFTPDPKLPPHERVAQILSAGVAGKKGRLLEGGSPEQMADAIIEFLRQHGFLESGA